MTKQIGKEYSMKFLVGNHCFNYDSSLEEFHTKDKIMNMTTKIVIVTETKEAFWYDDANNNECEPIRLKWDQDQFEKLGLL